MVWKVELYEKDIEKFLDSLSIKERIKVLRNIGLLERFGLNLRKPYVISLKIKGLKELRIVISRKMIRLLFFYFKEKIIVILHGFVKKTQKTPAKKIKIALQRMQKYKHERR